MKIEEILKFSFVRHSYYGVLEIYPQKATNSMVLSKVLLELQKDYELVKLCPDWIRAFKKSKGDVLQFESPERLKYQKLRNQQ